MVIFPPLSWKESFFKAPVCFHLNCYMTARTELVTYTKVNKRICNILSLMEIRILFTWFRLQMNQGWHFWVLVQRKYVFIWYPFNLYLSQKAIDDSVIKVAWCFYKEETLSHTYVTVFKVINSPELLITLINFDIWKILR